MELKQVYNTEEKLRNNVLIVPYGIETGLLIVLP